MAVAHTILTIAYHLILRHDADQELGSDSFDQRNPEATARHWKKRVAHLGDAVALQAAPAIALA